MNPNPALSRRRLLGLSAALGLGGALSVAGCTWNDVATTDSSLGGDFFDGTSLHSVSLTLSDDAWDEVRSAWQQSSEKVWAEVTLTIDGTAYKRVGARLKGNSTLRQTANTAAPQEYPWLLRLDKFVDGQSHQGVTEFAIRVNRTTSALNEALALDLMGRAGLVTQRAAYAAVTVGDSAAVLRLVCEHPSEAWIEAAMSGTGRLYKAEASGDYSYRGDDPAAYEEVFDQEAGQEDLTPLTDFLRWINESSDADFAAGLPTRLDVESFATYLAFEDLVDNYDDIEGPGNNSYLWSDTASSRMTVLGWDHNLWSDQPTRRRGCGSWRWPRWPCAGWRPFAQPKWQHPGDPVQGQCHLCRRGRQGHLGAEGFPDHLRGGDHAPGRLRQPAHPARLDAGGHRDPGVREGRSREIPRLTRLAAGAGVHDRLGV